MADALAVPNGMSSPVKDECPADTGVSEIPVFTTTRQPDQSAPGATLAHDLQGPKPSTDEAMPASTIAAARAPTAVLAADGLPATPYSLPSLPATPPSETVEFDAEMGASATIAETTELPAEKLVTQLMNDTPSDSASEPHSEQAPAEQPAVRMYRFRPEFIPARRSPPGQSSSDDLGSPEPLPRRASTSRRKSSRRSVPESSLVSPDSAPADNLADGAASTPEHLDIHNSLVSKLTPLSPSTAGDASDNATTVAATAQQTPSPEDSSTPSKDSTPSAADDSIATRRPMRTVRQAKLVTQETPRRDRPGKADTGSTTASPATRATSAKKATPIPKSRLEPPAVERRITRRSGLPSELAVPQPTPKGKRRRSESDKNLMRDVPRELLRLQDTKEYKHVDEDPVVYTVWSNGKYVPANAAGEPLSKRVKPTKDAEASKPDASAAASTQEGPAEEEAAHGAPRPPQKRLKKWLTSGLYAGQAMPKTPTAGLTTSEKKAFAKIPELAEPYKPNKTLPMPIFNGLRMLLQGRDFKLPFDVFNPLPPGQPKPVKFGKFNKNRFVGDALAIWKKSPNYDDVMTKCVCKPETGCDEDCQNRIMLYECNDTICNVGAELCNNREFQKLAERTASKNAYNIGVEVFKTPNRGHGIRASRGFAPGQIIMEYIGEIITEEESDRRMNELYKDNECYYLMSFDQSLIIDGTSGSVARFVNHSCDPNCRMIKWFVAGQPRIALFAGDRTIQTGEELTYDYNFDPYSSKNVQSCLCGSENCRGILGPRKSEKAVSKAAAAEKAAAEKAAADKAKSGSGSNQKKPASGASKRKHDVYSMDAEDEDAPAAKKVRTASGQQQNSQATKKAAAAKAIMTTKAALEALAAEAAKKARLEKASKAAKAARAAKAAKAAEAAQAAEAAKKAKTAKATKAAKTAKASPAKPKPSAATKAAKAQPTVAKATKPIKAVKAVQPVKVVKTAKGLKASKTMTKRKERKEPRQKVISAGGEPTPSPTVSESEASLAQTATDPPVKTTKTTKATKATKTATGRKAPKEPRQKVPLRISAGGMPTPDSPESEASQAPEDAAEQSVKVVKTAKHHKTPKEPRKKVPGRISAGGRPTPAPFPSEKSQKPKKSKTLSVLETGTAHQPTPMAQAVAGPAKAKSPTKAHKNVKFVKKARSQTQTKLATGSGSLAAVRDGAAAKKAPARRRQVPKKVVDITPAAVPVMDSAQSSGPPQPTPSGATDDDDEPAAQLFLEAASNAASNMSLPANSRATTSNGRTGQVAKPVAAVNPARPPPSTDTPVSEEIEDVSMFDDDRMLLDAAVGDSAMDTIHVAPRSA